MSKKHKRCPDCNRKITNSKRYCNKCQHKHTAQMLNSMAKFVNKVYFGGRTDLS